MAVSVYPYNLFGGTMVNGSIYPAAINASSSGANTVVAAFTGKRIVVLKYKYIAARSAPVLATWQSSGGTVLDGPCDLSASGGAQEPFTVCGHFCTLPGEALVLYLGTAIQVGGNLLYTLL
jgi:hypothetical protein